MAIFKEVWQFSSPGITGASVWSEVYYSSSGSLAFAAAFGQNFLAKRLALLHPINILNKIRLSDIANPRATTLVTIGQSGTGLPTLTPAPIDSAIICNLASTVAPGRRKLWLRGWIGAGGGYGGDGYRGSQTGSDFFSSIFKANLAAWFGKLQDNGYIVLVRQKANVVGFTPFYVSKVDGTAGNGYSVITTNGATGFAIGSQAIFARFSKKDFPALNGVFTVVNAAGNQITIPYVTPENQALIPTTGYVRQLGYLSTAVIDASISGPTFITGRKSKGPFSGSRGAKSATRKLRYQS